MSDDVPVVPLIYEGDGIFHVPNNAWAQRCDKEFVVHERYAFTEVADRNMGHHRAYFASVNEAWKSLHDSWGDYFRHPDHLRKFCLIHEGYCTTNTFTFSSDEEAARFAVYFRKPSEGSEFRIVIVKGSTVTVYVALSQQVKRNGKGMDAQTFKESAVKVSRRIDAMLGTKPGTTEMQRASA